MPNPEQFRTAAIPGWCRTCVLLVAIIALTALFAGWGAGVDAAVRISPGFAAMVPSTAVLLAANSLALLYPRTGAGRAGVLRAAALLSLTVALTNIAVMRLGAANGIDALISSALGQGSFGEDRMALATSVCFSLLAISLLTINAGNRFEAVFVGAATGGLLLSLVAVMGYLFDVEHLYEVLLFSAMALHTSLSFVILFTAVLFARPDWGWMPALTGSGEGSAGARRLMPLVIGVPLVLCFLVLVATRARFFDAQFGLSLLAILIVVLLAVSVLRNAVIQNRMQQQLALLVQQLTNDNEILLQEVYHRVKNNLQQINALILLEARSLPEGHRDVLHSLSSRVGALASVHRLLLSSPSLSALNLSPFLRDLCNGIMQGSGAEKRNITCVVSAEDRLVNIDFAISIGLLVNEFITNALKHAFVGRENGMIRVSLKCAEDGRLRLIVQDDGCGVGGKYGENGGTGSRIVRGLVRQLGGSMRVSSGKGTRIEVEIPSEACR